MMKRVWHLIVGAIWLKPMVAILAQTAGPAPVVINGLLLAENGHTLQWTDAGSDFAYTVQARSALQDGLWIAPRATVPWPVGTREWFDPGGLSMGSRFYRVVVVARANRGHLVSDQEVRFAGASEINQLLLLTGVSLTVSSDVRVHKLTYETVDPWGGRVVASGALAMPQNPNRPLALCSYQHGTIAKRSEAPSAADSLEQLLGVVMAGSGYATVLPDYLGLGDSPGVHPYHHAASEATACVDMLRAARDWCTEHQVELNGQLFLIGYSQGVMRRWHSIANSRSTTPMSSLSPLQRPWPAPMICPE